MLLLLSLYLRDICKNDGVLNSIKIHKLITNNLEYFIKLYVIIFGIKSIRWLNFKRFYNFSKNLVIIFEILDILAFKFYRVKIIFYTEN